MFTELGRVSLKSGEEALVARVDTPDPDWAPRIAPLLAHKGGLWNWQIERTVEGPIAPLEAYYYLALLGETGGKTQAYAEAGDTAKIEALEAAGFRPEATLRGQMKLDSGVVDVVVLSRQ